MFQCFVGHHLGHITLAVAALPPAHNFLGNSSCMGKEVLSHTMVGSVLCDFLYLPTWNILYAFICSAGKHSFKSPYSFWQHDYYVYSNIKIWCPRKKKVWYWTCKSSNHLKCDVIFAQMSRSYLVVFWSVILKKGNWCLGMSLLKRAVGTGCISFWEYLIRLIRKIDWNTLNNILHLGLLC